MRMIRTWLQLFRAPNLLTVPGEPLAGFLLASPLGDLKQAEWAVAASLCFYGAGLLFNDVADYQEDLRDRPGRPIPSGQASRLSVSIVGGLLIALGAVICAQLGPLASRIGLLLIAAILAYDFGLKKIPVLGPLTMGACRGLSLLLGAAASSSGFIPPVLVAAGTTMFYIAAVTQLARHETAPEKTGRLRSLHVGVLAAGFLIFLTLTPPLRSTAWLGFIGAGLTAVLLSITAAYRLIVYPAKMAKVVEERWSADERTGVNEASITSGVFPATIGLLISNLLFIQAAFCLSAGWNPNSLWIGVALIALWPVNRLVSRVFYAS
jgi:hypothetical protein